jgi:anti-sigma factor RsiW
MRARILPLDTDEHQAAQALLPWYVNGTLDPAENGRVQAHLADCQRCQADAAWQAKLRHTPALIEPGASTDLDRHWTAMRRRLSTQGDDAPHEDPVGARWIQRNWLQLAVGVQSVMLLALAVAWLGATQRDEPFRVLGAAPNAASANAVVVFRPDATEAQIRLALRTSGARLVDGPTVTDAYLLHVPAPGTELLSRLRAQSAVLRVESLEAEGPR